MNVYILQKVIHGHSNVKLSVSKQAAQTLDGERFNLRKLKDLEFKEQYQIEITNRFSALGT